MNKFQKDKYTFSSIRPLILVEDDIIEARSEQINSLISELISYKVLVRDLINNDISYSTRNEILNIALFITENVEIYDKFLNTKDIPVSEVCIEVRIDKKYIEKYRDYIIAYVLIFGEPSYGYINDYLQIVENKDEDVGKDIIAYEEKHNITGIVIGKSNNGKKAIIITSLGEFKKVSLVNEASTGEEVHAAEKKTIKDYKLYISIISIFVLIFILAVTYKYNDINSTIVIETTSQIKLEVNGFNRVLNITSPTEKGNELIKETNLMDKNIDKALRTIIQYANENDMITGSGVIVTINGKPLRYNDIGETEQYIYEKDVNVRFNNSGSEHKIN